MGYSGGKPTTPVNSDDVVSATGYNNHDWGHFCLASNIKKWSLWKPYRCEGEASPTNADVAKMKFGIDVGDARYTPLENAIRNVDNTQPTPASITPSTDTYKYLPPTGGAASPYRITDFADFDDETAPAGLQFKRQYDPTACAPDEWDDWTLSQEQLTKASNVTLTNLSGDTDWVLPNNTGAPLYTDCKLRWGFQSHENIGNAPSNAMPLTLLFGEGKIISEVWRIGIAVYLPHGEGDGALLGTPRWMAFAGRKPLVTVAGADVLPDMASNTRLCKALLYNIGKGTRTFSFIPCFLLNSTIARHGATAGGTLFGTDLQLLNDSKGARLLLPPTFALKTLTVTANPVPGQIVEYWDSAYRGRYASNLAGGTYKIKRGLAISTSSGTSLSFKL